MEYPTSQVHIKSNHCKKMPAYFLISASAPKIKFWAGDIFNSLLHFFLVITKIINYENMLLPSFIARIWICGKGRQHIFSDALHWTLQTKNIFTHFRLIKLLMVYCHLLWCWDVEQNNRNNNVWELNVSGGKESKFRTFCRLIHV